jgi:hypothetical protein
MRWHYVLEREGRIVEEREGELPDPVPTDPFIRMNPPGVDTKATVSCNVQRSLEYGSLKCSFTLTIHCAQDQQTMEYAASHAFATATRYVNNGMGVLVPGIDPLPVPYVPV